MNELIEQKLKSLRFLNPASQQYRQWLKDSSLWAAVYSVLRLSGVEMPKGEVVDVLSGKIIEELPINMYAFTQGYAEVIKDMQSEAQMQASLSIKLLSRWHEILFMNGDYRSDNHMIFKWGYLAPHFNEIPALLDEAFKPKNRLPNPIDEAIRLHNVINETYAYGEDSPVMALTAFYYVILAAGYPLPAISSDLEEYDRIEKCYFAGDAAEVEGMLKRSLLNRLEIAVQLALSAGDKE